MKIFKHNKRNKKMVIVHYELTDIPELNAVVEVSFYDSLFGIEHVKGIVTRKRVDACSGLIEVEITVTKIITGDVNLKVGEIIYLYEDRAHKGKIVLKETI
jgi:hypothetical protein